MPEESHEPTGAAEAETLPSENSLPFLIKLVAALLILIGLDGTAEIVLVIAGKDADINLGNLIVCVVGFGLLRWNRAAWGCTTLIFGLATIGAVGTLIGLAIPSCRPQFETPADSLGSHLLLTVGIGAVTGIILFKLFQKDVIAVFNDDSPEKSRVREATSWGWVIAIVGGFAVAERVWVEKEYEDLIEGTFVVDTSFRIFDATTDESIDGIIIRSGYSIGESTSPNIRITGLSGSGLRYSGYAFYPIDVTIGADGYEGVDVAIDENTPLELEFSLKKIESDEPPP